MISSNKECAVVMRKTCEALLHLHKNGYLHNDLKGNNVVLECKVDTPVIIDFGKSCQITKKAETGRCTGNASRGEANDIE